MNINDQERKYNVILSGAKNPRPANDSQATRGFFAPLRMTGTLV